MLGRTPPGITFMRDFERKVHDPFATLPSASVIKGIQVRQRRYRVIRLLASRIRT